MEESVKKSSITTLGGEKSIKHRGTRRSKTLNKINNIQNNQIETENDSNFKTKTIITRANAKKNHLKSNQTKLEEAENVNKDTSKPKTIMTRAKTKKHNLTSSPILEDQCMRGTVAEVLNTSLVNETSIKHRETQRNKTLNKVNNETENVNKDTSKPKTIMTRAKTKKHNLTSSPILEDQCMRGTVAEVLNTSLVNEKSIKHRETQRNKTLNIVNNETENVKKDTSKPKTIMTRAKTKKHNLTSSLILEDQYMRGTVAEVLNTSLVNEKSIKHRETQRNKTLNKVNNETENVNKDTSKPKTIMTRAKTKKHNFKSSLILEDQCMRGTVAEVLNTSLVIEPQDNITEVEPVIKELEMETIIDEVKKNIKKDRSLKKIIKKKNDNVEKHSDQDSESPLPVLIVEKAQVHRAMDDSVKSVLHTTQNLTNNRSPPKLNIIDDFNKINPQTNNKQNKSAITKKNNKSKAKKDKTQTLSNDSRDNNKNKSKTKACSGSKRTLSTISEETKRREREYTSDGTIPTTGKSPITARGDLESAPPNTEQLNQPITPRNLDVEYLNQSTQDFFGKLQLTLNTQLNAQCTKEVNTKINNNSPETLITIESSSDEIRKWLPTRKVDSRSSIENIASVISSNIQDWLSRNDREKPTEIQLMRDHFKHIKEKLDTTHVETLHASNKKLVSMLVDAHKNLYEQKADHRRQCRGIVATIDKFMDEVKTIVADLETRFEKHYEQLIKNFEQNAEELLLDECQQKKAMLTLLQDDLQIVSKLTENKK